MNELGEGVAEVDVGDKFWILKYVTCKQHINIGLCSFIMVKICQQERHMPSCSKKKNKKRKKNGEKINTMKEVREMKGKLFNKFFHCLY